MEQEVDQAGARQLQCRRRLLYGRWGGGNFRPELVEVVLDRGKLHLHPHNALLEQSVLADLLRDAAREAGLDF